MNASPSDLATILDRWQTGNLALLRQTPTTTERVQRLAALLHELTPQAAFSACLLRMDGRDTLAIHGADNNFNSDQQSILKQSLASCDPLATSVRRLPAVPPSNLQLLFAAMHEEDRARGFLALALPADAAAAEIERAETLLAMVAPITALCWSLESLRRERAELAQFALVGQAFAGMAHELNNALNSMMLQTSVVQLRVDEKTRSDLAAIRQNGVQAAGLLRTLQYVVQERREKSYSVDVNSVLAEILEEQAELRRRVSLQLADQAPHILSTRSAVKQLLRLLLQGICAGTKASLQAETQKRDDGAALNLTIREAAAKPDAEGEQLALEALLWQNLDEVGRLAGQSLLQQLNGTLTIDATNDGNLVLRVHWEKAA